MHHGQIRTECQPHAPLPRKQLRPWAEPPLGGIHPQNLTVTEPTACVRWSPGTRSPGSFEAQKIHAAGSQACSAPKARQSRNEQVFLPRRFLLVRRRHLGPESVLQADLRRVVAGEGRGHLGPDAVAHSFGDTRIRALEEIEEQPAAQVPGKAETPPEDRRPGIERAVDVDLLHRAGPVAVVAVHLARGGGFHRVKHGAGHLAPADRVETQHGTGVGNGIFKVLREALGAAVHDVPGTNPAQQVGLFLAADDVDEFDSIRLADLHQHLAKVRGGGRVDDGAVTLGPHRFHEAERRERVHEQGRTFRGRGLVRQHDAGVGGDQAILGKHGPADHGDALADEMLKVAPGPDDFPRALVSDGHGLPQSCLDGGQEMRRNLRRKDRIFFGSLGLQRAHVRRAEEQAEVGRIDRRGLDTDEQLALRRFGHRQALEVDPEHSVFGDRGSEFPAAARHAVSRVSVVVLLQASCIKRGRRGNVQRLDDTISRLDRR